MEAHTRLVTVTVAIAALAVLGITYAEAYADDHMAPMPKPPKPPMPVSTVLVKSVSNSGAQLLGFYTELYMGKTLVDSGNTPYAFMVKDNKTYTIKIANHAKYGFGHWQDTNSTNATRVVNTSHNMTLVAVYNTVPGKPTGLVANATSPTQVAFRWIAPSYDGGMPITGYRVSKSTDGHSWYGKNTRSTNDTFVYTGLEPDTKYYFRVLALNAIGASAPSDKVIVMTPVQTTKINGTSIGTITLASPSLP